METMNQILSWSAGKEMTSLSIYFESGSELCGANYKDENLLSFHQWVEQGAITNLETRKYYRSGGHDDNPVYRYIYETTEVSGVAMGRCPWATQKVTIID